MRVNQPSIPLHHFLTFDRLAFVIGQRYQRQSISIIGVPQKREHVGMTDAKRATVQIREQFVHFANVQFVILGTLRQIVLATKPLVDSMSLLEFLAEDEQRPVSWFWKTVGEVA